MFARLNQINAEIADVERLISSKNQTIISALAKGTNTLDEENEVVVLNKALQLKKAARRKLMSELRILDGGGPLPDLYIVGFILFGVFVSVMLAGDTADLASPEH